MKTLAKAALCAFYKYSGFMGVQESLQARVGRPFMSILLFHRVTDDIPEDGLTVSKLRFERLCGTLRRNFHTVPLTDIFRIVRSGAPMPRRTLAITFDDCYRDNLFAARILAVHGLPASFFIPSSYVGTDHVFEWDRGLKRMPNLSWDDVREMSNMGFEIGSHTVSHANLGTVSQADARVELMESKAVIEEQIGRDVRFLAFPFGGPNHFHPEYIPLLEEAGYEGCLSGCGGFVFAGVNSWILPREPVPCFKTNVNLEVHLSGCLGWFYGIKRQLGISGYETPHWNFKCQVPLAAAKELCQS